VFPKWDDFNLTINYVERSLAYYGLSETDANAYGEFLEREDFVLEGFGWINLYERAVLPYNAKADIWIDYEESEYYISLTVGNPQGDFDASVIDDIFKLETIRGEIYLKELTQFYNGDQTDAFEEYASRLENDGYECDGTYCIKDNNGPIVYEWYSEVDEGLSATWRAVDSRFFGFR
jgi:hypothetical protein